MKLNNRQAGELLGLHYKTVQRWTHKGVIPGQRAGEGTKKVRFEYDSAELRRWKKENPDRLAQITGTQRRSRSVAANGDAPIEVGLMPVQAVGPKAKAHVTGTPGRITEALSLIADSLARLETKVDQLMKLWS